MFKNFRPAPLFQNPGSAPGRGSRESDPPPPTPPPPLHNYRAPPAHRFHKYKLRLLYFIMQKLTPYSIKFIKKKSGGAFPQTFLGRHCADGARHPPPPQPINAPPPATLGTGLLTAVSSDFKFLCQGPRPIGPIYVMFPRWEILCYILC